MKKLLIIFLLTNIFNCNFAAQAAQAQAESKVDQEKISHLDTLFQVLMTNAYDEWDNQQISDMINEIKVIFNSGVDVNIVFKSDGTPLNYIADNERLNELAVWLISNGANVNKPVKCKSGASSHTPLFNAACGLNFDLMEILINNNANVNFANQIRFSVLSAMFQSPMSKDIENNWKKTIKLLLISGATFNDQVFQNRLKSDDYREHKRIFEQVIKEIIAEYRAKINAYNKTTSEQLYQYMPKELGNIIQQYADYSDDEIIPNIIDIRKALGELDEQGRPVQFQVAAAAAANLPGGAAAQ